MGEEVLMIDVMIMLCDAYFHIKASDAFIGVQSGPSVVSPIENFVLSCMPDMLVCLQSSYIQP